VLDHRLTNEIGAEITSFLWLLMKKQEVSSVFASLDIFGVSWFLPGNSISKLLVSVRVQTSILYDTNWPVFVKICMNIVLLDVASLGTYFSAYCH
jgi:hypothetical protein